MTIAELRKSALIYVTPADIADILHCDPHSIRVQAHADPSKLGFPVIVTGRRIRIPREPFLQHLQGRVCS